MKVIHTHYKNCKYIKVCNIVDEYVGKNYKESQKALLAYGFTNINFIVKKDLKRKRKVVDGYVETISFDGETEFDYNTKYPTNANVVITYHTYIDAEDEKETKRATSKCQNCGATFDYDIEKHIKILVKFCYSYFRHFYKLTTTMIYQYIIHKIPSPNLNTSLSSSYIFPM